MGGYGSGRLEKQGRRDTTDTRKSVDVLDWNRTDLLTAGKSFSGKSFSWGAHWWLRNKPALEIRPVYLSEDDPADWLEVQHLWAEDTVAERINMEWTPCAYGGARPWLLCPWCGRRARLLYLESAIASPVVSRLACRTCLGLAYECQRQDETRRLAEKAKRLRRKADGASAFSLFSAFPARPTGMHWATYLRLREASETATLQFWEMTMEQFAKMDAHLYRKLPQLKPKQKPNKT